MYFKLLNILLIIVSLSLGGCQSSVKRGPTNPNAQKIVHHAKAQIGTPYRYGGLNPKTGFDCSGLVFYSHKRTGQHVPRTTGEQYRATQPISRKHLRPGDLVFFRFRRNRQVSHVGIYLGANRFVHAPSSNKRVSVAKLNSKYWSKHFVRGGRFRL